MERVFDSFLPAQLMRSFMPAIADIDSVMQRTLGFKDIKIDVMEQANNYVIRAEIPGVSKDDLTVDLDSESGMLTIAAEKTMEPAGGPGAATSTTGASGGEGGASSAMEKSKGDAAAAGKEGEGGETTWHHTERTYGLVSRSLRLPSDVDPDKVEVSESVR